ncbi:hypothetical protein B0H13DRAFT_2456678 [Mycena leptocephala]|nr:hypothetical protein B0H13DRAFT_2456678 [Mycena leptocephala]
MGVAGGYKGLPHPTRIARNYVSEQCDERRVLAPPPNARGRATRLPGWGNGVAPKEACAASFTRSSSLRSLVLTCLKHEQGTAEHREDCAPSLAIFNGMPARSERRMPRRGSKHASTSPTSARSACETESHVEQGDGGGVGRGLEAVGGLQQGGWRRGHIGVSARTLEVLGGLRGGLKDQCRGQGDITLKKTFHARTALDSPPLQAQVFGAACAPLVYTHCPHPPQLVHDVLEAFVKPHQYLNDLSDVVGTPSWTGTRSLLELVPVSGKVARRRSLNGRPFGFTEVILYVPFAAFPVRASLHSILRPHGLPSTSLPELDPLHAVTGYRGLLVAVFLLPESERESPPTRHSCLPVLSCMVRHRRCSTACRSSAHLPLAPVPCTISMAHRMRRFVVYCLAGSLLRAVSSTHLLGEERVEGGFQNTPPSTRSIVCRDYRENLRYSGEHLGYSLALDELWSQAVCRICRECVDL